jgi:hypothetical protein
MTYRTDCTFTDKEKRTISFQVEDNIVAHVDGKQIGAVEFDVADDGYSFLYCFSAEEDYRHAGIATGMIKLAVEVYGRDFDRHSTQPSRG